MTAKDAKTYRLSDFVIFCFFLIFGTKRKHTGLSNSESAKELVRIRVLAEKLDLCLEGFMSLHCLESWIYVFTLSGGEQLGVQHPATKCYSSWPIFRPTSIDAGWCTRPS